ncbi:TPA: hypothetical protein U2D29_000849 [Streptococcus suis]|uniref:hypothetical protein n=1 Tax=Streptococcus suis TaxID=1307 RepID=UPI002AAD77AB|nr:hypothetical protein [Streptococcus suis]
MKKEFIEKIQDVKLYHSDDANTPLGVAYDISKFPVDFGVTFKVFFFNLVPNKDYVIALYYIAGNKPEELHLLNNVTLNVQSGDMIKYQDGYGLAFGTFSTSFPIDQEGELMIVLELRALDNMEKILDTYSTFITFEEKAK